MQSMRALLDPKAIAVVGASQQPGRGTSVVANLRDAGFSGEIYAVNPRYTDVLGYRCYPSVSELPDTVECIVIAIPARVACDVMEQAFARGIRAAIVLAGGFDDDEKNGPLGTRLKALAQQGMCIAGPNCFGVVNVKTGMVAFNGVVPKTLTKGRVALVSQSGSLGNFVFGPLIRDRKVGFSYFVSCGNQIGATIEDYVEYFVDDPDVNVIAAIVEDLKNPRKLERVAAEARAQGKRMVFVHVGRSAAGKMMTQSHTGALAGNAEVLSAFLRRCGIVQAASYDEFVETIALFAHAKTGDRASKRWRWCRAAAAARRSRPTISTRRASHWRNSILRPKSASRPVLPELDTVTNPIDATGAVFYDPGIMTRLIDAVLSDPGNRRSPSRSTPSPRRTTACARSHRPSPTPRARPIKPSSRIRSVRSARSTTNWWRACTPRIFRSFSASAARWARCVISAWQPAQDRSAPSGKAAKPEAWDFISVRDALAASGVSVVEAVLASSTDEAVAAWRKFGVPVALKAEADGLLHKSDIGGVRLNCNSESAVSEAFDAVVANARKAGFADAKALIQPMSGGIAEAYAGIIDDPLYGPAIVFGLGGIFIEILKDTAIEMAPLTRDDALAMIHRIKAAPMLLGARGRPAGDVEALAEFLVRLSHFAVTNAGQFRALDLNPIIVKRAGEGVVAVDIAVDRSEALS